jgi:hypothetical protein
MRIWLRKIMVQKLEDYPTQPDARSDDGALGLRGDLIWGVAGIAREIGRNVRQTFHLLENDRLPARKIGGRWCASRSGLRQFFATIINGEVV